MRDLLLVTGITGHSGSFFLRELVKNQYPGQIRCIVRSTSDASELDGCPLKIDKRIGDLRDQEFLNRTLQGVETVLHIGSIFYSVNLVKAAYGHLFKAQERLGGIPDHRVRHQNTIRKRPMQDGNCLSQAHHDIWPPAGQEHLCFHKNDR